MEYSNTARKRRPAPGQPTTRPPVRLSREKKDAQKTRSTKESSELSSGARSIYEKGRPSVDSATTAKSFKVGNVGRNGTLYLKPNRVAQPPLPQTPVTPPSSAGRKETVGSTAREQQAGNTFGSVNPKPTNSGRTAYNTTAPVPPLSLDNVRRQTRTRSHSFSTMSDAVKAQPPETGEFQLLLNGQASDQRPKSSIDLTEGLASFRIPHYRLGTPRWSDRGTAHLHNSIRSSITEDMRSSVFTKSDTYDRFPAPPGRERFNSRQVSGAPYLHPSQANSSLISSRTPTYNPPKRTGRIDLTMYDHVEAHINDPSLVRYSITTGRIVAATPARLVAQITSPWFLDYELLSDFFLTYRSFLTSRVLLDCLLVRMNWALANGSDSGRIVTVRTFVALRHWILNYFPDDFLIDHALRQKFCDLVNDVARDLLKRPDRGGGDLNVIGELKKCWRRICAMFWPVPEVADMAPDVDILPGEDELSAQPRASATSMMQSGQRGSTYMDWRRSSVIQIPAPVEVAVNNPNAEHSPGEKRVQYVQNATIPATPQSEQSLTVLSCSVPFLKNMMSTKENATESRPNVLKKERPSSERSTATAKRHNRSASFSDALRDERAPLSSGQPESVDIQSLPTASFTGGLVRGLLLQPSPSNLDLMIPLSPPLDTQAFDFAAPGAGKHDRDPYWMNPNVGVKKAVNDVKRAFSHRKRDSPASSARSTNSSGSRSSGHSDRADRSVSYQMLQGPPRVDVLGETIESTYREAFDEASILDIVPVLPSEHRQDPGMRLDLLQARDVNRSHSHVTTGSRSIVIVDDTGVPDLPTASGGLPPISPTSRTMAPRPLFGVSPEIPQGFEDGEHDSESIGIAHGDPYHQSPELPLQDLLAVPESAQATDDEAHNIIQARKSSSVHPSVPTMPSTPHQLRRRPGGDLREADHVHDLERAPRPETGDSYSTFSQAILSSGEPSADFSNVHVVGQDDHGMPLPLSFLQGRKKDSWTLLPTHSSQPNMRPSMKAKVSHLAKLPDEIDEGGIEDALARLEGKAASPTASVHTINGAGSELDMPPLMPHSQSGRLHVINANADRDVSPSTDELRSQTTDRQGASIYYMSDDAQSEHTLNPKPSEAGARDNADATHSRRIVAVHDAHVTDLSENAIAALNGGGGGDRPTDVKSADSQRSFLLDDNESLSDISTEIAEDQTPEEESLGVRSFYFDDTDDIKPTVPFRPPPTPPSTAGAGGTSSAPRSPMLPVPPLQQMKPKEVASPAQPLMSNPPDGSRWPESKEARRSLTVPARKDTAHLPWVLAFESDVIAEQLTIVEKDALDEVDWKDLIALNWRQSPCPVRNWVEFLKREDGSGIDIVVARFNLVVKWVVSECVLTEVLSERAKCITKFIHIAERVHRLRNYATMYQIVLALLSSDMARMHKTWSLVPQAEKNLLNRLEKLCNPRGNFHQLRVEMESASTDDACIPFIGLYTHDLMFNAQKPSRIEPSPPGGEPLINFERYQTAAAIVKSLLTLIEASARYVFRPHPEVLSRCLWLAALPDCEVSSRSKTLEQ